MKYCTNCGAELREGESFCPHCGQKISVTEPAKKPVYTEAEFELEDDGEWESPTQEECPAEATRAEPRKQAEPVRTAEPHPMGNANGPTQSSAPQSSQKPEPAPKKKFSGLSIAAFICSLTIVLSGLGILLAIIDLVKSRTQPRKKGLSIAALIIAGIFMLLAFIGNNIDLETLMAPKEETFAEIRGGTVYAADGFEVAVGNDNWVLADKQNNLLVFCPAAEKEREGGPATSIWVYGSATGRKHSKSPEEYVELALKTERYSVSGKPKSLTVNGNYKGAWAEGKRDSETTRMAAWKVEDRLFSIAYYGVGLDRDGEAVYQDILNSFTLRTPQDAASSEASQEASDVPTQTNTPVLDGTLVYSPADEFDFAFTLNDPGWKADFFDDGVNIVPADDNKGQTGRILVTSVPIAQLSAREQDPDVIVTDFMESLAPSAANDLMIHKFVVNGGYLASMADEWTEDNWVEVAVWMAGKHAYLMALIDSEWHSDAESVFYGILSSFRLASEVAPQAAQTTTVPKKTVNQEASLHYGDAFLVMLREDGTVTVKAERVFYANDFQDLSSWTDIVAIDIGQTCHYVLGLKSDGTVCISIPSSEKDRYFGSSATAFEKELQSWRDIVSIEAGAYTVYGVNKNGKVVAACFDSERQNTWHTGENEEALQWGNIVQVKEIGLKLFGRTKSGSWVSTGKYPWEELGQRSDAVDLNGDDSSDIMTLSNGKLKLNQVDANNQYYGSLLEHVDSNYNGHPFSQLPTILSSWLNIKKILVSSNGDHIIGLKNDGTLVSVFNPDNKYGNQHGQCNVAEWKDVIDITGDKFVTFGLKADGTVLCAGLGSWYYSNEWR